MSFVTIEVDIRDGQITPRDPGKIPATATGFLTILTSDTVPKAQTKRIRLPIVKGDGKHVIDPTPQELDNSLWGDEAG